MHKAYDEDNLVRDIMEAVRTGQGHHTKISLAECEIQDNKLYHLGHLYIPGNNELRLQLIKDHRGSLTASHPGVAKALELLNRQYTWPEQRKNGERYIRNCHTY